MKILHIAPNKMAEKLDRILRVGHSDTQVWSFPSFLTIGAISNIEFRMHPDQVIVWHGNDAESVLLFAWCCTLPVPLYHIDAYAHRAVLLESGIISKGRTIVAMGNLPERGIRALFYKTQPVSRWKRWIGGLQWKYWHAKCPTDLRVLNSRGHLVAVKADYYDNLLYFNISETFRSVTYTIGLTMLAIEQSGNFVPDTFLMDRLNRMIEKGVVEQRPWHNDKIKLSLAGTSARYNFEIRKKQ